MKKKNEQEVEILPIPSSQVGKSLVDPPANGRRTSLFDDYNLHETIRRLREEGYTYAQICDFVKDNHGVFISYSTIYSYCVRKGLTGNMDGDRKTTINTHEELLQTLNTVDKSLALVETLIEEIQYKLQKKLISSEETLPDLIKVQSMLEKLLIRKESLIKTLTQQQSLIYRYVNVSDFMGRLRDVVINNFGSEMWQLVHDKVSGDYLLNELLSKIPVNEKEKIVK